MNAVQQAQDAKLYAIRNELANALNNKPILLRDDGFPLRMRDRRTTVSFWNRVPEPAKFTAKEHVARFQQRKRDMAFTTQIATDLALKRMRSGVAARIQVTVAS